jgi:hypothetical protein
MRKLLALIPLCIIIALSMIMTQTGSGCSKPAEDPHDTITPPPPPPVPDTVTYIKKLEETYISGNPNTQHRTRDYNFYYDNQKRLTMVGIKNYGPVLTDSLTTKFFYNGNSQTPYMIIMPNVQNSSVGGPSYYDTTYITYGANNLPVRDSSTDWTWNNITNTLEHKLPLVRQYSYPNNLTAKIDWSAMVGWSTQPDLFRRDTVKIGTNGMLQTVKGIWYYDHDAPGSYTVAENIMPSGITNPLSKLNISGTAYSLIYSPVKEEILGSRFHWVVYTGNPLPYYLDFCSQWIPNSFFLASYNRLGALLNGGSIAFSTEITPWPPRGTYPQEIKVSCTWSLPGDKIQYKYFYY